ncbi:ABCA1, partial [Symbiodinium sp. KB8]
VATAQACFSDPMASVFSNDPPVPQKEKRANQDETAKYVDGRLALAAEHASDVPKLEKMRQTITEEWFGDLTMRNPGVLPGFANLTHPRIFTGAELEKYLDQEDYGSPSAPRLFGALLFNSVGGDGGMGAAGKWDPGLRCVFLFDLAASMLYHDHRLVRHHYHRHHNPHREEQLC